MGLHQFSLTYDPVQDRALLRISTTENEEIHCHLTRRYSQLLSQVIRDSIKRQLEKTGGDTPASMDQVVGMEHDAYVQKNDFSKEYEQSGDAHFPLGREPVLLVKIQARDTQEGLLLILSGSASANIELRLKTELMHGLLRLIEEVAGRADWRLDGQIGTNVQGMDPDDAMLVQ